MKNKIVCLLMLTFLTSLCFSQKKYFTKTGKISFFSKTSAENIDAHSNQLSCMLNSETGDIAFKVLIKSFEFEKALMQEHFNENYMESDKLPLSTFEGKVDDISKIKFSADETYDVSATGKLTIHGVTKEVKVPAKITVKENKVTTFAKFTVSLKDYNIKNDKTQNIAEKIEITVDAVLSEFVKK